MTIKFSRILLGRSIGCQDFCVVAGSYIRCFSPTNGLLKDILWEDNHSEGLRKAFVEEEIPVRLFLTKECNVLLLDWSSDLFCRMVEIFDLQVECTGRKDVDPRAWWCVTDATLRIRYEIGEGNHPVNPGSDFFSAATNERVQGTKILIIVHHVITKIIVQDFFPRCNALLEDCSLD